MSSVSFHLPLEQVALFRQKGLLDPEADLSDVQAHLRQLVRFQREGVDPDQELDVVADHRIRRALMQKLVAAGADFSEDLARSHPDDEAYEDCSSLALTFFVCLYEDFWFDTRDEYLTSEPDVSFCIDWVREVMSYGVDPALRYPPKGQEEGSIDLMDRLEWVSYLDGNETEFHFKQGAKAFLQGLLQTIVFYGFPIERALDPEFQDLRVDLDEMETPIRKAAEAGQRHRATQTIPSNIAQRPLRRGLS